MFDITRRHSLRLASALAAPAILGATPALAASNVLSGGFDVGPGGLPGKFNPLAATAGFTWLNLYLEPLVFYDPKLSRIGAGLALKVDAAADGLSYTFHLDPKAKFHDGTAFTSDDVAFTMGLAKNGVTGSIFSASLAGITTVETPDAATVVLKLAKPNTSLLDVLTKIMMLPKHALGGMDPAALAQSDWWHTKVLGTGPFMFKSYTEGQFVELSAFAGYRRGAPKLAGLVNRYFKSTADAVAALRAGEIQFTYIEPNDAKLFDKAPHDRVIEGESYVVNYVGFNHLVPLWKDQRVRAAVMHAIDRQAIVKSLLGGAASIADCAYTAGPALAPGLEAYPHDPAKAKQLLAAAGWDKINGTKPLPIITYYGDPLVANILAAMQSMLAQVGIHVTPRQVDVATYNGMVRGANTDPMSFPLTYAGAQDGPDPGVMGAFMESNQAPPAGANVMRVAIPALDKALGDAAAEVDDGKRVALYRQAAKTMNRELPWGFMWVARRYGVVADTVQNFVWTPAPGGGGYDPSAHLWSLRG